MRETVDIVIPRENVNDESATVVAWLVEDGARVEPGQYVAQIETSKATMDLEAPCAGILRHLIQASDEAVIGAAIGQIVDPQIDLAVLPVEPPLPETEPELNGSTRISPMAKDLIRRLNLDEADFRGHGLVRSRDIQSEANGATPKPAPVPSAAANGVPTRVEPLSRTKRTEGNHLRSGHESTLASVVTVQCSTRGFREASGESATAIIVFETARLLAKYPEFNAYHVEGNIHYYQEINIGFAVDTGRNLKVLVIRNADKKGIVEITDEMRELTVAYLGNKLAIESLAGGTFTLSDLSAEGVTTFQPLINRGQAAILGVGAEVFPLASDLGFFNLVLAYDHQLSEGRAAARFLKDLADRLGHHESSLRRRDEPRKSQTPRCSRCMRSHSALMASRNYLLQAVTADGGTQMLCNLCVGGWS